jgi:hypothetical protein
MNLGRRQLGMVEAANRNSDSIVAIDVAEDERRAASRAESAPRDLRRLIHLRPAPNPSKSVEREADERRKCISKRTLAHPAMTVMRVGRRDRRLVSYRAAKTSAGHAFARCHSGFADSFADRLMEMFEGVFIAAVHHFSERAGFEVVLDALA